MKSRRWPIILTGVVVSMSAGYTRAALADNKDQTLNPLTFVRFHIISKEPVSSNSSLFRLQPWSTKSAQVWQEQWKKGVWSISIKQPQLQIARDYTPLPPLSSALDSQDNRQEGTANDDDLNLWIRREVRGEMSNYLHALPVEAKVEIRGPKLEYQLPDQIDRIVFLAGGTGIAPALQIAHSLRMRNDLSTRMDILWANRSRDDCIGGISDGISSTVNENTQWWKFWAQDNTREPVRSQKAEHTSNGETGHQPSAVVNMLSQLKNVSRGTVRVDYFVDDEKTLITPRHVEQLVHQPKKQTETSTPGRNLIIISGPDGFVNFWAGPKQWLNGREVQGPLKGALGQMKLSDWEVVKL